MVLSTKSLNRLALIVLDAVNTVYLKQLVNTAYLESIATVFGADDIPVKVRCHRLTLCSYPLMREKCFGGERSRATNSGRVLIAKRLRREGLLLHSPQNIPVTHHCRSP